MKTSTTRRRLSIAAVLAVLALTFTACGADGDDDAGSTTTTEATNDDTTTTTEAEETTTTESDETTTTESEDENGTPTTSGAIGGMAKDMVVDIYKKMGMSQKQADCAAGYIIGKMGDITDTSDMSGLMEMGQEMLEKCDIDPSDLKAPSGN